MCRYGAVCVCVGGGGGGVWGSMFLYVYMLCMHVFVCICTYMYVYVQIYKSLFMHTSFVCCYTCIHYVLRFVKKNITTKYNVYNVYRLQIKTN